MIEISFGHPLLRMNFFEDERFSWNIKIAKLNLKNEESSEDNENDVIERKKDINEIKTDNNLPTNINEMEKFKVQNNDKDEDEDEDESEDEKLIAEALEQRDDRVFLYYMQKS